MRCNDESIPDQLSPWLPTTASGVARQGTCENYARAGLGKASEETAGTVEGETHTHKDWYLKYRNNDWKVKRAGRHVGAKECRYIVPTGNKMKRKYYRGIRK